MTTFNRHYYGSYMSPDRTGVGPGFNSQGSVTFFHKYCFPNLHRSHWAIPWWSDSAIYSNIQVHDFFKLIHWSRISPEFRPIYLFPHIVKMRLACRLKLFQTFVISTALPLCITLMTKVDFASHFNNILSRIKVAFCKTKSLQTYLSGYAESKHCGCCRWGKLDCLDHAYAHRRDL